ASRRSLAQSFEGLEAKGSRWHLNKYWMIAGNYVLMSFYCAVTGWMLWYCVRGFMGDFGTNTTTEQAGAAFSSMLSSPSGMLVSMFVVIGFGFAVCALGLRRGVERVSKPMMLILLALLVFLAARSFTLDGFAEGMSYYLAPNVEAMRQHGLIEIVSAAMAQAFFTLSIGVGAIQIFGTYMSSEHTLTSEALRITLLDTTVALLSGIVIFPACFSYGIEPGQGPGLVFVTMVSVFSHMEYGAFWGGFFFLFMLFAALSTLIAVFENIIATSMEICGVTRGRAVLWNLLAISVISVPCVLGFNVLSDFHPLGGGSTILDLEDFLVSSNILPLGALCYALFVTSRTGMGFRRYVDEANVGQGIKIPARGLAYYRVFLPVVIFLLVANCYFVAFGG
nr:sodium-dependent transporter [Succinivibrionaceae bacterium]